MIQRKYIILHSKDNCATSLEDIPQGTPIKLLEETIVVAQEIQMGHKFALNNINIGDKIIKYGEIIGIATVDIKKGEWIHTHNEVFALYLNIVDAMLEHQNSRLYVGKTLDRIKDSDILRRKSSEVRKVRVVTRRAASMFYLNIQTWKRQSFIQENYPASVIEELQRDLERLAGKSGDEISIEWGLRQIVFERR